MGLSESSVSPKTVLLRYLGQLRLLLDTLERQGPQDILERRLTPEMFPLRTQVRICANFALRIWCPLTGGEPVSFDNDDNTFAGLRRQLQQTQHYLEATDDDGLNWDKPVTERAGFGEFTLPMVDFTYQYALPNFYFHLSMVYAIGRASGVNLSKGHYDGFHSYPPGFSFENPS
ncbi:DUF1993 domain-containing protein [Pseudomaricurvus alkylphenolicus]|uniref:DUF1993 domain-containing protein n=1 Tax=Pseudomaricurvus alkylphenolicus TaxID=1306991 RepID=UPI00141E40F2|nr:DUF1993 domain-containing protein [Pseudomaricurvus alkylphenolicus]NIB39925.1 DUF1993 domain-containing protein [Pseudomaricurvus alkylphenolicus]